MTLVMEEADTQGRPDHLARQVTPSLAHQALRGHLVPQVEVTMGNQDHQGLLVLQDHLYLELTGARRLSIFLDHRVLLEHLDYLDTPLG